MQLFFNLNIFSQSQKTHIDIKEDGEQRLKEQKVKLNYKVSNDGPSSRENFVFKLFVPQYYILGNNKLEITQMDSIECSYKNEYFNIEWNSIEESLNFTTEKNQDEKYLNFPKNQTILVDCQQKNVQCLKAEASIPYFEYSSEDQIRITLNFNLVIEKIGKAKLFYNF